MSASKIPAAENTLRILRFLATRRGPVAAASIAQALGLPRSSVYHLLRVMQDQGFVAHLPEERLYGLGIKAFELSSAYVRQDPMARSEPLLRALVDTVGESAHLAVLHGRDVVYLVEERAPLRPSLVTDVGVRIPAHLTASGRSMLAELPPPQVRALYPNREAFTSRWEHTEINGPSRLRAELERTRARGWATEDGDVTPDFASVAVAARDHRGLPVAGLRSPSWPTGWTRRPGAAWWTTCAGRPRRCPPACMARAPDLAGLSGIPDTSVADGGDLHHVPWCDGCTPMPASSRPPAHQEHHHGTSRSPPRPRPARHRTEREELADRGAAAHADEQPGPGGRRAPR